MKRSERRAELKNGIVGVLRGTIDHLAFFHSAIADKIGLNATDHMCMQLLLRQGPQSAGELAEQVGLSTGAITGLIDRLEHAGYAVREQDPNDRRSVIVCPVRGKILAELKPIFDGFAREIKTLLGGFNISQLVMLAEFLVSVDNLFERETTAIRSGMNKPWRGPQPHDN